MWFRMNKAIRIGINQGTLLIWIFNSYYFGLIWCDLRWFQKEEKNMKQGVFFCFGRRIGRRGGICDRKTTNFVLIWHRFEMLFWDFFQKNWDYTIIWIHVFSSTKKHKLLQWISCSSFVWISCNVRLWWNEM